MNFAESEVEEAPFLCFRASTIKHSLAPLIALSNWLPELARRDEGIPPIRLG